MANGAGKSVAGTGFSCKGSITDAISGVRTSPRSSMRSMNRTRVLWDEASGFWSLKDWTNTVSKSEERGLSAQPPNVVSTGLTWWTRQWAGAHGPSKRTNCYCVVMRGMRRGGRRLRLFSEMMSQWVSGQFIRLKIGGPFCPQNIIEASYLTELTLKQSLLRLEINAFTTLIKFIIIKRLAQPPPAADPGSDSWAAAFASSIFFSFVVLNGHKLALTWLFCDLPA